MLETDDGKILVREIEEEMKRSYIDYAMSVIVGRALPDVRDGMKPVHRRVLYGMHEMGLQPNRPYKKCARIVGDVMGKYHPHGDSAIYDALVRLAQNFSCRATLVDGHGNFGSVDGDAAAAMRYTEARLSRIATELLRDIDKETVKFVPNYDETEQEPAVLPARFPNLLVNGSEGIAVGMATRILPHNLREVIAAVVQRLDNPESGISDVLKVLKGPDFPTGAIILGRKGIEDYFATGRGSVRVRGVAEIEETKQGRFRIAVTELPYQVNKARLAEKIAELVRDKKIEGISDIRDESDRRGMRLVIELKRDAIPQVVINNLYKHTSLQTSFGVINLALVDGVPKVLSILEILDHYIAHQKEIIVNRTKFELRKAEERLHILEGLLIALKNLDEVIKTIRASSDPEEARGKLMKGFKLTEVQAQAILDMRLQRLTALERDKIESEHAELVVLIAELKGILADPQKVIDIIKKEISEIAEKYGDVRRTRIAEAEGDIDSEDLIPVEDMVVTVTQSGYIKRVVRDEFKAQRRGGKGVKAQNIKEGDVVDQLFHVSTHDWLLVFTSRGKVYKIKVHELPKTERTARGQNIVNLLPFDQDEKFMAAITVPGFDLDEYIVMATRNGLIKKTALREYENINRNGIIGLKLKQEDELIKVRLTDGTCELIMVSSQGKSVKFNEEEVRPMGRNTSGVIGMRVRAGDSVISMDIADPAAELFVINSGGIGKRTPIKRYPLQGRGGSGVKTIRLTKGSTLVGARVVRPDDQLLLVSEAGILINVEVKDISCLGRDTQGVKVMNLNTGDKVSTIALIPSEDEDSQPELLA